MTLAEQFKAFLEQSSYRSSSVDVSLKQLGRIVQSQIAEEPVPQYCANTARRVLTFLRAKNVNPELLGYLEAQNIAPIQKVLKPKLKTRKLEAKSFSDDDWMALQQAVNASDEPEDRVLEVMCLGGLRISDTLRLPRASIDEGLRTGQIMLERKGGTFVPLNVAVEEPWVRLRDAMVEARGSATITQKDDTVARFLSARAPHAVAGKGPYFQIYRRLKHWQSELGLEGRANPHRIRRTFAIKTYDASGQDFLMVQQALNNKPQATLSYLDEQKSSKLAELQRSVRNKGMGK